MAGEDTRYASGAELTSGFQRLTRTRTWRRLENLPTVTDPFNVFQVLEDSVSENSWSRILAALFASSGSHDLGMLPIRAWVAALPHTSLKSLAIQAAAATTVCEWGTNERRRLDILVKLLDVKGRLLAVVGVENKVWSGEQHGQFCDYQTALCRAFPDTPKVLIFLTPDTREPVTAAEKSSCSCMPCSYKTVVLMCNALLQSAPPGVKLLLRSLRDYIEREILQSSAMKSTIQQQVRKLYQNSAHRRILETIFENRLTLEQVLLEIEKAAADRLSNEGGKCDFSQWPKRTANPQEIIVYPRPELARSGFSIFYMLRSTDRKPFIGSSFTILILARCDSAAARKHVTNLTLRLPTRFAHNFKNWWKYELLWEGDSYVLQDLGKNDARNLSNLMASAISRTYRRIKSALSKSNE